MRRTLTTCALTVAVAAALGAAADAQAATVDLEILSVQPSRDSVPAGVPTRVKWVVYVRNNGEETSGSTASIGPVGGAGTFKNVDMQANEPGEDPEERDHCDPPGGENPRCRLPFLQRSQTQLIEVTDTVVAPAPGSVTRSFTADVLGPDTEANPGDNTLSVTLPAVLGALPTVSKPAIRGRSSLSAKERRRAVGRLTFALDRDADVRLDVERRAPSGRYRKWGTWLFEGNAGANGYLLPNRIDYRDKEPKDFFLRVMGPGTYRLTIVATDGEGHTSKPVRRRLVVPRRR